MAPGGALPEGRRLAGALRYDPPLVEATFLRREKRFFAYARLDDGREVVAHCPNTGRMTGSDRPGARCRLSWSPDPRRRLAWTLEQIEGEAGWILVHTGRPNAVVAEAIRAGRIPELSGYETVHGEWPWPDGGRVDLLLLDGGNLPPGEAPRRVRGAPGVPAERAAFVEVKNVTLVEGDRALFPDAVSERATRHLRSLAGAVAAGHRGVLFFHVGRPDGRVVSPARAIDPIYAETLAEVVAAGVEVLAWRCDVGAEGLALVEPLPVRI